jgi:hypothetical protein
MRTHATTCNRTHHASASNDVEQVCHRRFSRQTARMRNGDQCALASSAIMREGRRSLISAESRRMDS